MTTTFENAKVGDRVYSSVHGWGKISAVTNGAEYCLMASFDQRDIIAYRLHKPC
jgi:hypothetical protein